MPDETARRIDAWLARCTDPATNPCQGMAEAGLFAPLDRYIAIARTKAALTERTGLIGIGAAWGGRQVVGRYFIAAYANDAQRAAWLGSAASVAISEPGVGAHPKHLRTRAELDGDAYRITGEKAWVSNGLSAEVIIVFAITAEDADGRKHYSAFLVPRVTPGLTLRDMPGFHALRPSRHCTVTLDGCRVPRAALLGALGTAYERMALPFRDAEDAVGTFGHLGAFRWLVARFGALQAHADDAILALGGMAALTAVFAAGAESVVAALDAGRLASAAPALIGLRILAADMLVRARSLRIRHVPGENTAIDVMLDDLEATLSIASLPRQMRQARLGATLMEG
ncbi:MAG: acyl-CoA dehydrogenase [Acetobacteraceae bacterium]|nr:acyl-CoA dehydrogenase [Acetobacteraceae bacterium]